MKNLLLFVFISCATLNIYAQKNQKLPHREEIDRALKKASSFFLENADSAKFYANKGLKLAKKYKDNERKVSAYIQLSNIYNRDNDLPKSFEFIELGEIVAAECENEKLISRINFQKGSLLSQIGNMESAVVYINKAKEQFSKDKDSTSLAVALNALSSIYAKNGNYQEAIALIKRAIRINEGLNKPFSLAANKGNLALYYININDGESARTYLRQALHLFRESDSKREETRTILAIAESYSEDGKSDSAFVYLENARKKISLIPDLNNEADYWKVKAGIEQNSGNFREAFRSYKTAHEKSVNIGLSEGVYTSLKGLYESAKEAGMTTEALNYLERFKAFSDSLEKISGKNELMKLALNKRFEHEQNLMEAEKRELQAKQKNIELEAERKNYLILSIVLAGIVVLIFLGLILRKKQKAFHKSERQKEELSDELELRNKELVSSAIQVLRKSEEMKKTIESLKELNERASPQDSKQLLSIIRKLKFELEHGTWEEFEVPFKKLHSSFYNKLVEKYPDLTKAEIKVCSLLKLKMDTKQIAAILHKTPASIEVDRSRIRKKMGLTNTKTSLTRHISTNI